MSEIVIKGTGTYASGFAVQFTGDLTKGNKGDAVLYKVTRNAVDKKVKYPIEDCRIDKVEDGWYWVAFLRTQLHHPLLYDYQTIVYRLDTCIF